MKKKINTQKLANELYLDMTRERMKAVAKDIKAGVKRCKDNQKRQEARC